jgi:hypothetical protein
VNAILLLMGLLVLAYLGSFLVGGHSVRGAGLPSGVEYVALGFLLGPRVLDLVAADTLQSFEPVVQVALGWLAFGIGLDYGFAGDKRVRFGSLVIGSVGALLTAGAVAVGVWFTLKRLHTGGTPVERLLLSGGVGTACSETTRHAVRWVVERHNAKGPLADRINELAHADDLFPLLAVAVLFALQPATHVAVPMPLRDWPAITVAVGLLIGAGGALLVRSEIQADDMWGVLFGVTLITIGTTARLLLSTLTACFFLGIAMSLLSHHRKELRAMVGPTERPVLLPALLLAGTHLDFKANPALPWIAGAALGARIVAKLVIGLMLSASSKSARKAGPLVGLSLLPSGALAISIGLAFALRFPGAVGDTVLAVAAITATAGEFLGPARLRRALRSAGEVDAPATQGADA